MDAIIETDSWAKLETAFIENLSSGLLEEARAKLATLTAKFGSKSVRVRILGGLLQASCPCCVIIGSGTSPPLLLCVFLCVFRVFDVCVCVPQEASGEFSAAEATYTAVTKEAPANQQVCVCVCVFLCLWLCACLCACVYYSRDKPDV